VPARSTRVVLRPMVNSRQLVAAGLFGSRPVPDLREEFGACRWPEQVHSPRAAQVRFQRSPLPGPEQPEPPGNPARSCKAQNTAIEM
jgi:hypothetical protein